jgi:hypothetical protein
MECARKWGRSGSSMTLSSSNNYSTRDPLHEGPSVAKARAMSACLVKASPCLSSERSMSANRAAIRGLSRWVCGARSRRGQRPAGPEAGGARVRARPRLRHPQCIVLGEVDHLHCWRGLLGRREGVNKGTGDSIGSLRVGDVANSRPARLKQSRNFPGRFRGDTGSILVAHCK